MRFSLRYWLAGVAAGTLLAVAVVPSAAKEANQIVDIGSYSGAYLAARVAEVDNDLGSAIAYYQRALVFDPDNKALQQSLMLALIADGEFDAALPYAEKLKTEPEVERFSRLALATEAFRKRDYEGAQHWLKLALESDLDRLIVSLMAGWAKAGAGDGAGAIAHIEGLQGPDWYRLFVTYQTALVADDAGDAAKAETAFAATIENIAAGSAAPEVWLRAAEAYAGFLARRGEKDKALDVLRKAEEFAPARAPIVALRGAIEAGTPVPPLVSGPNEGATEVLLSLATALNRGGGEAFVRLYLQYALALNSQSDAVLIQLAGVAEQQDQAELAIDYYRRIPDTSPLKHLSELQLGLNLADLDRQDEAIKHLAALVEANPDDMRAHLALGSVYSAKEDYRAAAAVYDRAVVRIGTPKGSDWNIFYQRGIAYERLKEWPKAEPNFRKALELYPEQPQVLNYLGYSWVDMNMNLEEGLEMIQRAVDLRPSDGYIVDSLGWAFYRLGRFDDAVRELERAVSLKPDDAVLNDHLGDAYWRVGRKLEATFQWSHARDMKPDADVLAQVQKKLAEGLPPIADPATAGERTPEPTPVAPTEAPDAGDQRTETVPSEETPDAANQQTDPSLSGQTAQLIPAGYTVLPGQSLWSIAAERLGAGSRYLEILELNPELRENPGRLMPGQELRLPDVGN
ncbi:MAG: tetratricopeptide repeat protein [Rhizobiaceae bacterium]